MGHTLSAKYILRKEGSNRFVLYNRQTLVRSLISPKLYVLLNLFRNTTLDIEELKDSCKENGIDVTDFTLFLSNPRYFDVLIPASVSTSQAPITVPEMNVRQSVQPSPARIDFFITKHCNLACKHCFEGSSPKFTTKEFSEAELNELIKELESANIQTLKITGGEPFSHPNIDRLLQLIKNCHFETIILTNALLLTEERISLIKNGDVQLGISLDGISSYTHDYIRGKGAFEKLNKILLQLKNEDITFCLTCTVNHRNFSELKEIIHKAFHYYGAKSLFINRLRPMGRTNENNEMVLSEDENNEVKQIFLNAEKEYIGRIFLGDDSNIECNNIGDIIECAAGNSLFAIDENFDVFPCIYGIGNKEYRIGNLLGDGIKNIWESAKWNKFRRETQLEDLIECKDCLFNTKCVMKNCRMKPVYEGRSFYDAISYCRKNLEATHSK